MTLVILGLIDVALALAVSLPTRQLPESFEAPAPIRWVFGHPWWAAWLLAFFVICGVMFAVAGAWNGVFRFSQWHAFGWGDVAVSIMVGFMAWSLYDFHGTDRLYASKASYIAWACVAVGVVGFQAFADYNQRGTFYYLVNTPHAIYHQVMMIFAVWVIGSAFIPSLVADSSWWVRGGIIASLAAYAASLAYDQILVGRGLRPIPGVNY
jgi:hypothetical protein